MYNTKQNIGSDMIVLNKVFEILNYISARVILIEKTPVGERYSVVHGGDIAYVYMTNTGVTINIYCDDNMVLRRIVSATNGADVKEAIASLQEKLVSRSKIKSPKTMKSPEYMLNLQSEILRINHKTK